MHQPLRSSLTPQTISQTFKDADLKLPDRCTILTAGELELFEISLGLTDNLCESLNVDGRRRLHHLRSPLASFTGMFAKLLRGDMSDEYGKYRERASELAYICQFRPDLGD